MRKKKAILIVFTTILCLLFILARFDSLESGEKAKAPTTTKIEFESNVALTKSKLRCWDEIEGRNTSKPIIVSDLTDDFKPIVLRNCPGVLRGLADHADIRDSERLCAMGKQRLWKGGLCVTIGK